MRRRDAIVALCGVPAAPAIAWLRPAHAQPRERMRRVGVLVQTLEGDSDSLARMAILRRRLQELGWAEGRNIQFDYRWAAGVADGYRRSAAELVALAPDVLLATSGPSVAALLQATRSLPIVFSGAIDPVGAGWVASLARPGGNATGVASSEFGLSVKLLEVLKEIAPRTRRVGVLRDPVTPAGLGQFGAIQGASAQFTVELTPIDARDAQEIERGIASFARTPNGGLILVGGANAIIHRQAVIDAAARHRLPAVYSNRSFVDQGGLVSYGASPTEVYRLAASFVDRILKGEKPADLPVQAPVKYETVLNMKTAKALGLDVPTSILLRADEVIE